MLASPSVAIITLEVNNPVGSQSTKLDASEVQEGTESLEHFWRDTGLQCTLETQRSWVLVSATAVKAE